MTIKVIIKFCLLDKPKFQSKSRKFQLGLFSLAFHQQGVVVPTENIPIIISLDFIDINTLHGSSSRKCISIGLQAFGSHSMFHSDSFGSLVFYNFII